MLLYCFGAVCAKNRFNTEQAYVYTIDGDNSDDGVSWETVRYQIEKLHGMQKHVHNTQGSYIVGHIWNDKFIDWKKQSKPLCPSDILTNQHKLIIVRKPLDKNIRPFIPASELMKMKEREQLLSEALNDNNDDMYDKLTEDEKLQFIVKQQGMFGRDLTSQQSHHYCHASEYICRKCGVAGHHIKNCPQKHITAHKYPTGIPKTLLRTAETEEEKRKAMKTDDGKYVLMRETDSN